MPDIDLDGGRVRDAVPSLDDADYVTRGELEGVINARNDARYLRRDGGNNLTEDIPAGGHTLTGIRDAAADHEPVSKAQLDALAATVATDAELAAAVASLTATIGVGGSGVDGALADATALPSIGIYEWTSISITGTKAFPAFSIHRVAGNVTISGTINVANPSAAERTAVLQALDGVVYAGADGAANGGAYPSNGAAAGGSIGAGGAGVSAAGGTAKVIDTIRGWEAGPRRVILGGRGGLNGNAVDTAGGGVLVLLVDGDVTLTGGTINANGAVGPADDCAGGGGGTVLIIATGTITGGTLNAKGGDKNATSGGNGGGGGGLVMREAATVTGGTVSVSGGSIGGGAGLSVTRTSLTAKQLRALLAWP